MAVSHGQYGTILFGCSVPACGAFPSPPRYDSRHDEETARPKHETARPSDQNVSLRRYGLDLRIAQLEGDGTRRLQRARDVLQMHCRGRPCGGMTIGVLRRYDSAMMKKPPATSAKLIQLLTKPCPTCRGSGWVCEVHTLRPMEHDGCAATGKPCRCNPEALMGWDDDWAIR